MRPMPLFLVGALCLALSCAAPAASPGQPETGAAGEFIAGTIILTPDAVTEVPVGGEFVVVLTENPSTGYGWSYTVDPAGSIREIATESFDTASESMVGAPVETVWRFRAMSAGDATLTYLYYRPWEKPETAVDKKIFLLKIVP